MRKILLALGVVIFTAAFTLIIALAHGGRTDSSGGHRDNNNVSGLGSYHYHHGYSAHLHTNGVCPYDFVDKTGQSSGGSGTSSKNTAAPTVTPVPTPSKKAPDYSWLILPGIIVIFILYNCVSAIKTKILGWNRNRGKKGR